MTTIERKEIFERKALSYWELKLDLLSGTFTFSDKFPDLVSAQMYLASNGVNLIKQFGDKCLIFYLYNVATFDTIWIDCTGKIVSNTK